MKHIGISQRLVHVTHYDEIRDCLDVRWAPTLLSLGYLPVILPTLTPDFFEAYMPNITLDGLILSGGNSLGESLLRDTHEKALIQHCVDKNIPILGICRGMQLLNTYFGGTLSPIQGHAATRHSISGHQDSVNSYHDYGILPENLASGLVVDAKAPDGSIEAFSHSSARIKAVMWHPEREPTLTPSDTTLIQDLFA